MPYFARVKAKVVEPTVKYTPFMIIPATGNASGYMVADGSCFSTFSYDSGSMIPIDKLNTPFEFKKNDKFYIDFTVTQNLQIKSAEIKCSPIGGKPDDANNPATWVSYPNMFYIQPSDTVDEKGRVTTIAEGKHQIKCYALIGYREDDEQKNGINSQPVSGAMVSGSAMVQILNTDIILLASMASGVPVVFPAPYFNVTPHIQAIKSIPANT